MECFLLLLVVRISRVDALLKLLRIKELGGDGVPVEDSPFKSVDSLEAGYHLSLPAVGDKTLTRKADS